MIVFINGDFVEEEEATVSVFDRGFLYGDGVFETLRIYNGKPFLFDRHIGRLSHGLGSLFIGDKYSFSEYLEHTRELIEKNNVTEGVLRIQATRGPGKRGYSTTGNYDPTVLISLHVAPNVDLNNVLPVKLATSTQILSDHDPFSTLKTTNKLANIVALREAEKVGMDDALLTNHNGNVTEASGSNVFWIKDGALFTPPVSSGCLSGITRGMILELAITMNLPTTQQNITPTQLCDAESVLLTNSVREIQPVIQIDGKSITISPLIAKLHGVYRKAVEQATS
jgi:aminodeoxychorismate lyase